MVNKQRFDYENLKNPKVLVAPFEYELNILLGLKQSREVAV